MRLTGLSIALCLFPLFAIAAAETPPLTPAEAAQRANEKDVMQMEVKSTGGDNNRY